LSKAGGLNETAIIENITLPHASSYKVSSLLGLLEGFKADYFENGIIPNLESSFNRNLFNTFLCYIDFH